MISVVIPVYNEGIPLKKLCRRIEIHLSERFIKYEIILVDDRSRDNSWLVMKELAATSPKIKIARLSRNFGQHNALTAGMSLAKGDYIVLMDCDGQDAPEYIGPMYDQLINSRVHVVYAKRKNRKDKWHKRLSSKIVNFIMQQLSETNYDPEIGTYRIMTKLVCDTYLSMPEKNRFIGGMFNWLNFQYDTLPVEHQDRFHGKSSYNFSKSLKLARLGILSSSTKLLSIGIYLGLTSSVVSVLVGIYYLILNLLYDVPLGYTSIIVSIFFVGSINMLILGIIGEYLREIFEEAKSRPNHIIEEKINFEK